MVVNNRSNIRWLTGFTGSNATVVCAADQLVVITDDRYRDQAPQELDAVGCPGRVETQSDPATVVTTTFGSQVVVGLESQVVTWAQLLRWQEQLTAAPVALPPVIEELRQVKDAGELARIERAALIADRALGDLPEVVVAGKTEREVAHTLDSRMRALGAEGPAYETIVASGPQAALPHARPSDRRLTHGDLVIVDVGALVDGYRSDMTRTYVVGGAPSTVQQELFETVAAAHRAGLAAVAPGRQAVEVDQACRDLIEEAGYGELYVHGTGHGVGLDIHELPAVNRRSAAILQPGCVMTVEPGLYLPSVGGVRIEDLVLVTDTGCRPLSQSPQPSV